MVCVDRCYLLRTVDELKIKKTIELLSYKRSNNGDSNSAQSLKVQNSEFYHSSLFEGATLHYTSAIMEEINNTPMNVSDETSKWLSDLVRKLKAN